MEMRRRYFRVIEREDGMWACHHDPHDIDRHEHQDQALWHIAEIASSYRPSRILFHHLDGRVLSIATLD
jgi:hypothetical protein